MRKTGKPKKQARNKKPRPAHNATAPADENKRRTLSFLTKSATGLCLAGGTGAYFYTAYQNDLAERDLSKIGNGKPAIVQIHDPNCPMCNALQKNARSALSNFEDGDLEYLVANIRTNKGRQFANQHNVPHVTLLLFNKRGRLENVLQGVRGEDELVTVFKQLLKKT